jgi:hypothetical protein
MSWPKRLASSSIFARNAARDAIGRLWSLAEAAARASGGRDFQ